VDCCTNFAESGRDLSLYIFMDFKEHPINSKTDFDLGSITLIFQQPHRESDSVPLILKGSMDSYSSLNSAIEWSPSYFQKIRLAFFRKLRDIKFSLNLKSNGKS
jgi:hypothetical protein